MLAGGRIDEAGRLLEAARPAASKSWIGKSKPPEPDFDWESAWIDYLDASGQGEAAQAARWASFERTLSVERAKAFVSRLTGFDDVEAETRAFDHVMAHPDAGRALAFLMDWPALGEAARTIQARGDDLDVSPDQALLWAGRLHVRYPAAAHLLLRKAAAAAFRRRDFATCDRLTEEADLIEV
jgi:hypothetical protein